MKKLGLVLLPLLLLSGCKKVDNSKSNIVESGKYSKIYTYTNVSYSFDSQLRCCVSYLRFNEDNTIKEQKEWCVYLDGFYVINSISFDTFYVCVSTYENDYYLIVKG